MPQNVMAAAFKMPFTDLLSSCYSAVLLSRCVHDQCNPSTQALWSIHGIVVSVARFKLSLARDSNALLQLRERLL